MNDQTRKPNRHEPGIGNAGAIRHSSFVIRFLAAATLAACCGCEAFEIMPDTPAAPDPAQTALPAPAAGGKFEPAKLESPNADVRRETALLLTKSVLPNRDMRQTVSKRLVVMAQGDPEALVRSAALQALLVQRPVAAVDVARRVRADASPIVRWDAAKILADLGGAPLVPALIEMLSTDPDENVRREAAKGLSRYDEPRVIQALIVSLDDESTSVSHAARESLVKLSSGIDMGTKREAWEKWWK